MQLELAGKCQRFVHAARSSLEFCQAIDWSLERKNTKLPCIPLWR